MSACPYCGNKRRHNRRCLTQAQPQTGSTWGRWPWPSVRAFGMQPAELGGDKQ